MFAISRKEFPKIESVVVRIVPSLETDPKKVLYNAVSKNGELVFNKTGVPYFVADEKVNCVHERKTVIVTPAVEGTFWNTVEEVKTEDIAEWTILELPIPLVEVALEEFETIQDIKEDADNDVKCIEAIKKCYSEVKVFSDFFTKPEILATVNSNIAELSEAALQQLNAFAKTQTSVGMTNLTGYTYACLDKEDLALPFYLTAASEGDIVSIANLVLNSEQSVLQSYWMQRLKIANPEYFASIYKGVVIDQASFGEAQAYATKFYSQLGLTLIPIAAPVVEVKLETKEEVKPTTTSSLDKIKALYKEVKVSEDFYTKPEILKGINVSINELSKQELVALNEYAATQGVSVVGMWNLAGYTSELLGNREGASAQYQLAAFNQKDIIAMANLINLERKRGEVRLVTYWMYRLKQTCSEYFVSMYGNGAISDKTFLEVQEYALQYYGKA